MDNIKCTLRHEVGRRFFVIYIGECSSEHYHRFEGEVTEDEYKKLETFGWGHLEGSEVVCDKCKAKFKATSVAIGSAPKYDTEDGRLHPGDMYYATYYHDKGKCLCWDDCTDENHLVVVLPNGDNWHVDGRASNCTMPEDKNHRCWVRHGVPPDVTVDKNGKTCNAGAGSIMSHSNGGWHGFLRNGYLIQC